VSSTAIREAIERDEAAAAEVDTPEPEPDTPEPEPEPEPQPAPPSEKELAALGKKIDAENDRHAKRLQELYGAMWTDLRPCPLCDAEGHLMPLPVEERDPAQVAAVHEALGEHEQPELVEARDTEECEHCAGYGLVLTRSKREEHLVKNCATCDGRGYINSAGKIVQYPPPAPPPIAIGNGYAPPPVYGEVDAWNRPAGHPHYNIAPADVR
jgi:hypothetical protein